MPCVADRRCVPCRTNDDLRPFVRGLARHLGEHPVMADDQRDPTAIGAITHGHAQVARLPWLHGHPGMKLAVVQANHARVVNNQPAVVRVAVGVVFHDGEATPDVVVDASLLERGNLGAVQRTHDRRVDVHAQTMQRILREHHQVHGALIAPCLGHQVTDALSLCRKIGGRHHHGQLQLNETENDTVL